MSASQITFSITRPKSESSALAKDVIVTITMRTKDAQRNGLGTCVRGLQTGMEDQSIKHPPARKPVRKTIRDAPQCSLEFVRSYDECSRLFATLARFLHTERMEA